MFNLNRTARSRAISANTPTVALTKTISDEEGTDPVFVGLEGN